MVCQAWSPLGSFSLLQQGFLTSRLPAEAEAVDWEAALKRQNAANDELCSENSQLQVEVQRLAAEDTELPEAQLANKKRKTVLRRKMIG